MSRPLILLGGSFDPIHGGHLALAWAVYAQCPQAEIRLMPTAQSPFKHTKTSRKHRLAMLRLALRDTPFQIERCEMYSTPPVYTIDTLTHIRQQIGTTRSLIFVMGQDSLLSLHKWKGGLDLLDKTHLWVFARASQQHPLKLSDELQSSAVDQPKMLENSPAGRIYLDPFLPPNISSTQLRSQLSRTSSLVPARVWAYNRKSFLYGF
ncbi:MAG: nicotinate (nicotinamide) nucleotide adenylyltransferase [Pseudomonadota bacterium]|jgi:nicotinate (nicotinamide) nucleotide adenylyltransferase